MAEKRSPRGPAPDDDRLFAPEAWPGLQAATRDLCWLLNRGYALRSAVELVGDRYRLARRQRMAIGRCACSDAALERRQQHHISPDDLCGLDLWLDGYNVLTAVEAALAGGIILHGRDGCYRDLANLHARYRKVEETVPALRLVGEQAHAWGVQECRWWLDRPMFNSGRLQQVILEVAADAGWNWPVERVNNPDKVLAQTDQVVVTSDSVILDRCHRWLNLARWVITRHVPQARVIPLATGAGC